MSVSETVPRAALDRTGDTSAARARSAPRTRLEQDTAKLCRVALGMRKGVVDEHTRAPETWRDRLDVLRGFLSGAGPADPKERAAYVDEVTRTATGCVAQLRRWLDADKIAAALSTVSEPRYLGRFRGKKLRRTELVDGVRVPRFVELPVAHVADAEGVEQVLTRCTIEGVTLDVRDGRGCAHPFAPADVAEKVGRCRRWWAPVLLESGAVRMQPWACGSPMCPDCQEVEAAAERLDGEAVAVVSALARAGCPVLLVTATQRSRPGPGPIVVTAAELAEQPELAELHPIAGPGEVGTATGGESFGTAVARVTRALELTKGESRRTREGWERYTVGSVWGLEVTERATDKRTGKLTGPRRAHAHTHGIVVLRPGQDVHAFAGWWKRHWLASVRALGGEAEDAGQDVQIVYDPATCGSVSDAEIERACRQVLKYPCRAAAMSAAALVEYGAATKGLKSHRATGVLHSATRAGSCARLVASLELEREGLEPLVRSDEAVGACKRYGVEDEAKARHVLGLELGPVAGPALVGWRARLTPEPEAEDPALGVICARIRGRLHVATRARLRMWARRGERLALYLAPVGTMTDDQANGCEAVPWGVLTAAEVLALVGAERGPPVE